MGRGTRKGKRKLRMGGKWSQGFVNKEGKNIEGRVGECEKKEESRYIMFRCKLPIMNIYIYSNKMNF